MTFGEMRGYTKRLNDIVNSKASTQIKNSRLANLMTDLEQAYQIPLFAGSHRMKTVDPFVMKLYRAVSEARSM